MKKLVMVLSLFAVTMAVSGYLPAPVSAQCGYGYGYGYYPASSYDYSSWFDNQRRLGPRSEIYFEGRPGMRRMASSSDMIRYPGDINNWGIYDTSGRNMGRVTGTVMAGDRPRYVLFRGDSEGAQDRVYPVPWDRFSRADNNRLYMNMNSQDFSNAPYFSGDTPDFNTGNWNDRIRTFYSADNSNRRPDQYRSNAGSQTNVESDKSANRQDQNRNMNQNQQYGSSDRNQQKSGDQSAASQSMKNQDKQADRQNANANKTGKSSQTEKQNSSQNAGQNKAGSGSSQYSGTSIDSGDNNK
jgi:hypothetical protein